MPSVASWVHLALRRWINWPAEPAESSVTPKPSVHWFPDLAGVTRPPISSCAASRGRWRRGWSNVPGCARPSRQGVPLVRCRPHCHDRGRRGLGDMGSLGEPACMLTSRRHSLRGFGQCWHSCGFGTGCGHPLSARELLARAVRRVGGSPLPASSAHSAPQLAGQKRGHMTGGNDPVRERPEQEP